MHWRQQLREALAQRRLQHLERTLRPLDRCARLVQGTSGGGGVLINLAGNDYLGLASHPRLIQAVCDAARQLGVGSGASRLVTGHLEIHQRLEQRFAAFKHAETALLLPTGYMANLATLTALCGGGEGDVIVLDKLNHASLIDAAHASGATVRVYPHRNIDKLHRLLERASRGGAGAGGASGGGGRKLIVTDSVFSMDGACADLPALCELRDRHDAILIVDEAHGTGVLGDTGSGLAEQQGVADDVDVTISTASKALGSLGGIVTGPPEVIDTLINAARSFIYTTAVPPTTAAAIDAALDVLRDEPHRRLRLRTLSDRLRNALRQRGWDVADDPTPIVPLVVGEAAAALALSARLEEAGFLIPAIRPPTVAPGTSRLRITLRCDLSDEDVERLIETIGERDSSLYVQQT